MLLKSTYIVMNRRPDLQYFRRSQKVTEPSVHSHLVDPEQESLVGAGQLQKRDTVAWLRRRECRARLCVKADHLLRTQIGNGPVELGSHRIDHIYLSQKGSIFQLLYLLWGYTFCKHNSKTKRTAVPYT